MDVKCRKIVHFLLLVHLDYSVLLNENFLKSNHIWKKTHPKLAL